MTWKNKHNPDARIRDALTSDLAIIRDIMNDAIVNTTSVYDYHPRSEEVVASWFLKKQADGLPVIVCEVNGNPVGYASYGIFRPWEAYRYSVEHSFYVHRDYRGQGFGKLLLQTLISKAKTSGYRTMIAGIDALNEKSIRLHQQFGFVEVGRLKEVGFKFDRWLDLVFMQLMLAE